MLLPAGKYEVAILYAPRSAVVVKVEMLRPQHRLRPARKNSKRSWQPLPQPRASVVSVEEP